MRAHAIVWGAAGLLLFSGCSSSSHVDAVTTTVAPADSSTVPTTVAPEPTESLTLPPPPINTATVPATTVVPATSALDPVAAPLRILVTNDDGVGAAGIDALVQGLQTLDFVEITVVAPLENQSGKGDSVTDTATAGPLVATQTATASGFPATAIAGTPADTVIWAVEQKGLAQVPDFVVSGINDGQNISTAIVHASGTIGAARRAAMDGIPSIAVSFSLGNNGDFAPAVKALLAWFSENVPQLVTDATENAVESFANMNVPNCPALGKSVVGFAVVPPGDLGTRDYSAFDCSGTPNPVDDVAAYEAGYVAISEISLSA